MNLECCHDLFEGWAYIAKITKICNHQNMTGAYAICGFDTSSENTNIIK